MSRRRDRRTHRIAERIATDVADGPEAEGEVMFGVWSVGIADMGRIEGWIEGPVHRSTGLPVHRGSVHRRTARLAPIERSKDASQRGSTGVPAGQRKRAIERQRMRERRVPVRHWTGARTSGSTRARRRATTRPRSPESRGNRQRRGSARCRSRPSANATCAASSERSRHPRGSGRTRSSHTVRPDFVRSVQPTWWNHSSSESGVVRAVAEEIAQRPREILRDGVAPRGRAIEPDADACRRDGSRRASSPRGRDGPTAPDHSGGPVRHDVREPERRHVVHDGFARRRSSCARSARPTFGVVRERHARSTRRRSRPTTSVDPTRAGRTRTSSPD